MIDIRRKRNEITIDITTPTEELHLVLSADGQEYKGHSYLQKKRTVAQQRQAHDKKRLRGSPRCVVLACPRTGSSRMMLMLKKLGVAVAGKKFNENPANPKHHENNPTGYYEARLAVENCQDKAIKVPIMQHEMALPYIERGTPILFPVRDPAEASCSWSKMSDRFSIEYQHITVPHLIEASKTILRRQLADDVVIVDYISAISDPTEYVRRIARAVGFESTDIQPALEAIDPKLYRNKSDKVAALDQTDEQLQRAFALLRKRDFDQLAALEYHRVQRSEIGTDFEKNMYATLGKPSGACDGCTGEKNRLNHMTPAQVRGEFDAIVDGTLDRMQRLPKWWDRIRAQAAQHIAPDWLRGKVEDCLERAIKDQSRT